MPHATFTKDFRWSPKANVRIAYKAGKTYPVTTACLAEAVRAGAVRPSPGKAAAVRPPAAVAAVAEGSRLYDPRPAGADAVG